MLQNKHYMFDRNCSGLTKRSNLKFENIQENADDSGGATDWEDEFSDKLCLSQCFTAHSGTTGAQTTVPQLACERWGPNPTKNQTPAISAHTPHGLLL